MRTVKVALRARGLWEFTTFFYIFESIETKNSSREEFFTSRLLACFFTSLLYPLVFSSPGKRVLLYGAVE